MDKRHTGQNGRLSTSMLQKRSIQHTNLEGYSSDIGETRRSLVLLYSRPRSDSQITVHLTSKKSSSSIDPQPSSKVLTLPRGWLPKMNEFTLDLVSQGEDFGLISILLETEWPKLVGHVDPQWLEHVASKAGNEDDTAEQAIRRLRVRAERR